MPFLMLYDSLLPINVNQWQFINVPVLVPLSAVSEAGGEELLVQLLQDGSGAAVHAAAVLTNMASQESLRCVILSYGAMQALLQPLQSADRPTLLSATQAMAALACDAEGRAEVASLDINHRSKRFCVQ